MEKPISDITANVPMMETKMETVGMSVDLMSCKNTYTTTITRSIASISVRMTELMEAYRNLLVSVSTTNSAPSGRSRSISSSTS